MLTEKSCVLFWITVQQMTFFTKLVSDGNFIHDRCPAHIVNLVVQKAIESIKHIIIKVRESVKCQIINYEIATV